MLNLLIAVISETHARVTEVSDTLQTQEMANLISDFIFLDNPISEAEKNNLVMLVFEKEAIEDMTRTDLADIWDYLEKVEMDVKMVHKKLD